MRHSPCPWIYQLKNQQESQNFSSFSGKGTLTSWGAQSGRDQSYLPQKLVADPTGQRRQPKMRPWPNPEGLMLSPQSAWSRESTTCHVPWASLFTIPGLSFLICQMRFAGRIKQGKSYKDAVQTVGATARRTDSSDIHEKS